MLRVLLRFVAAALFRVRVSGISNLPDEAAGDPPGGWICAGVPHRNWVEPFLLLGLMPAKHRLVTVADGPTAAGSWWRRVVARVVGGTIAVWPRGSVRAFDGHLAAVDMSLSAGVVVVINPETGPPSRPPGLRRLSAGIARFAASSGAPIVPVVFGGTDELYLGRRIVVRVLPHISPPPRDADRVRLAAWMDDLRAVLQGAAEEADREANSQPPRRKLWRWLSGRYPRAL